MAVAEAKKPSSGPKKPKSPRAYPSFYEMASDAISTLKERTGSSQYAIAKFLEEKHQKQLPSNFKKLLLIQLKRFVASGKFVKVKNSYKLPPARSSSSPSAEPAPVKKAASKVVAATAKVAKPKAKVAGAAKPKADTKVGKPKRKATPEAKGKPAAKVAKTSGKASPGARKAVGAKPKKVAVAKAVRKPKPKPKSVKSPAKKKVTPKKAKKGTN